MLVEGDDAVRVRRLHAAQVVLAHRRLGVHRVVPHAVALPQVNRSTSHRSALVLGVDHSEVHGQRHALGDGRGCHEAGPDVAAHDAAELQGVGAVGAITREGSSRLPGQRGAGRDRRRVEGMGLDVHRCGLRGAAPSARGVFVAPAAAPPSLLPLSSSLHPTRVTRAAPPNIFSAVRRLIRVARSNWSPRS